MSLKVPVLWISSIKKCRVARKEVLTYPGALSHDELVACDVLNVTCLASTTVFENIVNNVENARRPTVVVAITAVESKLGTKWIQPLSSGNLCSLLTHNVYQQSKYGH